MEQNALGIQLTTQLQPNGVALLCRKSTLDEAPLRIKIDESYIVQVVKEYQGRGLPL